MAPYRDWQDLTTRDFGALDPASSVAVLPAGTIGQHGPHLPLATDAIVAEAVARRGLSRLNGSFDALLLPPQAIGTSNENSATAGTLAFSAEQLIALWMSIGESVHRAGLRKIVFLNSNDGEPQMMETVARELKVRHAMVAVSSSWRHMDLPDGLIAPDEQRHGVHGGPVETSMMLHLRPDLVKMDKVQDIHNSGLAGDVTLASAAIGGQIVDHVAAGFAGLVEETSRYPLERIRSK